jgi:hypothetical protein
MRPLVGRIVADIILHTTNLVFYKGEHYTRTRAGIYSQSSEFIRVHPTP